MTKPSPHPFCVDCRHCRSAEELRAELPPDGFIPADGSGPWCVNVIDVVTGRDGYDTCKVSRRFLKGGPGDINPVCGLEGRLFEPAIEPVPGLVAYARGQLKAKETE